MMMMMETEERSRLDEIGFKFMEDPNEVTGDEALELFSDMIECSPKEVAEYFTGTKFVPTYKHIC